VIALIAIATAKAALIALFYMHLRYETRSEAHGARATRGAGGLRPLADARRRLEAPAMTLALAIWSASALACPVCARDGTPHLLLLLGAMIAVPYAVAALAVYAIRGGGR